MRNTRKFHDSDSSKSTFVYSFHKDTFSKITYLVLIAYLFFVSVILLVDALK